MATTYAAPAAASGSRDSGGSRTTRLVSPMPTDVVAGWVASVGVALFALVLRLHRLSVPGKEVFDEVYYRKDAFDLLRYGVERDAEGTGPGFVVHPPLGKWMIAAGEQLYGYNSLGWRFSAAVVGALSVLVLCRLGRRIFRSTFLGCFAGGLLALDGLHFTQSRIAMLDIFLMFWIVVALGCLVADRDQARGRLARRVGDEVSWPGPRVGFRPWRLAAGVAMGAAGATKWTAAYLVVALVLLAFAWDVGARRTAGVPAPFRAALRREALPIVGLLVLVPAVVYVASWAGWFLSDDGYLRQCTAERSDHCGAVSGWLKYHTEIWHFHVTLSSSHPYQSRPGSWPLLARPVLYLYDTPTEGTSKVILGIGTPAIWWAALPAIAATVWRWVSRRDWRAATILAGFGAAFLPWLLAGNRTMFLFYALPILPFMCLALALSAGMALGGARVSQLRRRGVALAVGSYALLVVVNFFWLYPILAAKVIPYDAYRARIWFDSWI